MHKVYEDCKLFRAGAIPKFSNGGFVLIRNENTLNARVVFADNSACGGGGGVG